MVTFGRVRIQLTDPPLFIRKATAVFVATLVLVPLVYFKLAVPAWLYLSTLLVIHVLFLYTYLARVSWRQLAKQRTTFALRILAVIFFIYLLAVLKFQGSLGFVLGNLAAGLTIHVLILFSLMAEFTAQLA